MVKQCPPCGRKQSLDQYTCELCGAELIGNGELFDALTFWDNKKPLTIKMTLIPLGLITASGIASASLGNHLILFVGIAAASIYYFRQNKS